MKLPSGCHIAFIITHAFVGDNGMSVFYLCTFVKVKTFIASEMFQCDISHWILVFYSALALSRRNSTNVAKIKIQKH